MIDPAFHDISGNIYLVVLGRIERKGRSWLSRDMNQLLRASGRAGRDDSIEILGVEAGEKSTE